MFDAILKKWIVKMLNKSIFSFKFVGVQNERVLISAEML